MAYIADVTSFSVLVFDLQNDRSWRVQNKLFFPCPTYGTHTIQGDTFDLMDGVFGMALSPRPNYSGKTFPLGPFPPYVPFGPNQHHNHNHSIAIFHIIIYYVQLYESSGFFKL